MKVIKCACFFRTHFPLTSINYGGDFTAKYISIFCMKTEKGIKLKLEREFSQYQKLDAFLSGVSNNLIKN